MAVSIAELSTTTIVYNSDVDENIEKDVRGGPTTLYGIYVDNSHASSDRLHVKFYDDISPTVGTTDPDLIIAIEGVVAQDTESVNEGDVFIPLNGGTGMAFANGLSYASVVEAGTAGTTAPPQVVKMALIVS